MTFYEDNETTSWSWRHAIMKSDELEPNCKLILYTLSLYVSEVGQAAFPSLETLQTNTGLSRNTLLKYLGICATKGWLQIVKTKQANGRQQVNRYYPIYPSSNRVLGSQSEFKLDEKPSSICDDSRVREMNRIYKDININKNINNKWNDIAEQYGLEKIKKLTPSRQKHLNARIKDAGGEHEFYEVINKLLSKNDFYTGNNDRGWKATFDYFLNPNKFAKVLESYTPENQETFSLKSLHEWFECFLDLKDTRVDILKRTAMTVSGENQDAAKEVLREVYAKHAKEQLTMEGWINKVKEKGKQ